MSEQQYRICVQGWIGERWAEWFDGLTLTHEGTREHSPITQLTGPVPDQAALRSLLNRIWDLGLTVNSVSRVETSAETGREME